MLIVSFPSNFTGFPFIKNAIFPPSGVWERVNPIVAFSNFELQGN